MNFPFTYRKKSFSFSSPLPFFGKEKKHCFARPQKAHSPNTRKSGQITIIPKPEFSGHFGGIPLLFTTIWGDLDHRRYNLPASLKNGWQKSVFNPLFSIDPSETWEKCEMPALTPNAQPVWRSCLSTSTISLALNRTEPRDASWLSSLCRGTWR